MPFQLKNAQMRTSASQKEGGEDGNHVLQDKFNPVNCGNREHTPCCSLKGLYHILIDSKGKAKSSRQLHNNFEVEAPPMSQKTNHFQILTSFFFFYCQVIKYHDLGLACIILFLLQWIGFKQKLADAGPSEWGNVYCTIAWHSENRNWWPPGSVRLELFNIDMSCILDWFAYWWSYSVRCPLSRE